MANSHTQPKTTPARRTPGRSRRSPRKPALSYWKPILAACAAVAVPALFYLLWPRSPSTLVDALAKYPEVFPQPFAEIVPLSSRSALGSLLTAVEGDPRRKRMSSRPCFFVPATEHNAGLELTANYSDQNAIGLEFRDLGIQLQDEGTINIEVTNSKIRSGLGVFNPGGPCRPEKGLNTFRIVSSEFVANKLVFSGNFKVEAKSLSGSADAGAVGENTNTIYGGDHGSYEDVVIAAVEEDVSVYYDEISSDPLDGLRVGLTLGIPMNLGSVTVVKVDRSGKKIYVKVVASTADAPKHVAGRSNPSCGDGGEVELTYNGECDAWIYPGTSLAVVRWHHDVLNRIDNLQVSLYQTKYE
jgi:hypothetical protein